MNRSTAASALVSMTVAFAVVALVPSTAHAALGDGLAVGPTRLHLGVETDLTYTSQAGAGNYGGLLNPGDLIAVFRGLVGLEGKSENFKLNLTGDVRWNQYAGVVSPATSGLSYFGASLLGMLQTNPDGKAGLDLTESFSRSNQTTNPVFGLGILSLYNDTMVRARFRPGGGAIEFGVGGDVGLNLYSPQVSPVGTSSATQCAGTPANMQPSCDPGAASAYDSYNFNASVDAKWRFLPKTGITLDAKIGYFGYVYGSKTGAYENLNAMPYNALLGFGTLLSTRFSFSIKGGYQGITYSANTKNNFGSFAGQADVGFRFSETSSARLGFVRNITPAGGGFDYYLDNRLFLELSWQPIQKLAVAGSASVDFIGYGGTSGRTDNAYSFQVHVDYSFLKWLKVSGRGDVMARSSSGVTVNDTSITAFNYTLFDATVALVALF